MQRGPPSRPITWGLFDTRFFFVTRKQIETHTQIKQHTNKQTNKHTNHIFILCSDFEFSDFQILEFQVPNFRIFIPSNFQIVFLKVALLEA